MARRRWPVIFKPGRRALAERVVLLLGSGVQRADCALNSSEALDVLGDSFLKRHDYIIEQALRDVLRELEHVIPRFVDLPARRPLYSLPCSIIISRP